MCFNGSYLVKKVCEYITRDTDEINNRTFESWDMHKQLMHKVSENFVKICTVKAKCYVGCK